MIYYRVHLSRYENKFYMNEKKSLSIFGSAYAAPWLYVVLFLNRRNSSPAVFVPEERTKLANGFGIAFKVSW